MRGTEYERLVKRFYSLQKRGMKLSLDGTRALLRKVGRPEKHLPCVLVGGTNGKGSACSLISSVLKASGYSTGLYTSPHLIDFRERIRISGECVSKNEAHELLKFLVPVAEREGNSFFETITALALRHFKDRDVDIVVAEVGLGGRLDSTNVLSPLVSIITGIAVEHRHILGHTLRTIACEKAGIMRRKRPVVTAAQGTALDAIRGVSELLDSQLFVVGKDLELRTRIVSRAGTVFSASVAVFPGFSKQYKTEWPDLYLGLRGRYQVRNAGCAILTCWKLRDSGFSVSDEAIERGLRDADWPGRLEERGTHPLVLFDVAHNPQAAAALAEALATIYRERKVVAVIGMVDDKDHRAFLRRLLPRVRHAVFTQARTPRALPARELARRAPVAVRGRSVRDSLPRAIEEAFRIAGDDELVCVTGSFYTVGEAMTCLGIGIKESI